MTTNRNGSEQVENFLEKKALLGFFFAFLCFSLAITTAPRIAFADLPDSSILSPQTQANVDLELGATVGFGGVYKNGFQTPVVVTWRAVGDASVERSVVERIEIETIDADGTPFVVSRPTTSDEIAAGRAETAIVFPRASGNLTVRLFVGERTLEKTFEASSKRAPDSPTRFLPAAPSSKPIFLVVGSEKLGLEEAFGELRWKEERRPNVVRVAQISELPTDFRSFESVDRMILTTSNPDFFAGVDANDPRIRAIERWVERGGDAVILAGETSPSLLDSAKLGALSSLSPGVSVAPEPHEFRVVNALVSDLKNVKNLALTGSREFPFLKVPVLLETKPNAIVEIREMETPLLVVRPVGLGTVVFFAGDLSTPPFSNWSGRGALWLKILGFEADRLTAKTTAPTYVKRGYVDLSGHLRSTLDSFDGVRVVPFSLVLGAIFLYLLAIGPLDCFLAKKVFKRPSATWATFPIYVVLFCVLIVWATRVSRPNETLLNRVDLIDVDVESGIVRDVSWFGLYSPTARRYDLRIAPELDKNGAENGAIGASNPESDGADSIRLDANETFASFFPSTLDGNGVGGAEQKTIALNSWDESYRVDESGETGPREGSNGAALLGVPTPARSSKSFVGRWSSRSTNLAASGTLVDNGLTLRGSVVNPFDVPIYSAFLVYPGGAYSLGTLPPGETPIEKTASRLETRQVLNEHRSSVPTDRLKNWSSTTYNWGSSRIPYILRTLSFYRFGGGEETFGIAKRLQGDVDLSELFRCGRAVVFGTLVDSAAEDYRSLESAGPIDPEPKSDSDVKTLDSNDSFRSTSVELKSSKTSAEIPLEGQRTVVVRLIVPLKSGANAAEAATP